MAFKTEFEFTLPKGFIDEEGNLHRKGVMRLATAMDEIEPMRDMKVQRNPGYLNIVLLSRVIEKLGDLNTITTQMIEQFFTVDMAYLQEFYARINQLDNPNFQVSCPHCEERFEVPFDFFQEEE